MGRSCSFGPWRGPTGQPSGPERPLPSPWSEPFGISQSWDRAQPGATPKQVMRIIIILQGGVCAGRSITFSRMLLHLPHCLLERIFVYMPVAELLHTQRISFFF